MPQDMHVTALGTVLRIPLSELTAADNSGMRDEGDALAALVREAWQDAVVGSTAASLPSQLGDGAELGSHDDPPATIVLPPTKSSERFLELLSSDVTQAALQLRAGELIMLHAGGIALADGRVIAFVAPSGHGKTTLTRALGEHHGYVSDETIAFDEQLRVYPYRKPLSMVTPGRPKQQVAPSAVGLKQLPVKPLRLAAVVLLDRVGAPGDDGPAAHEGPPTLSPLPLRDALGPIVAQTSYVLLLEHPLQRLAQALAATGTFVLRYEGTAEVSAALPKLIEQFNEGETQNTFAELNQGQSPSVDDGISDDWCPAAVTSQRAAMPPNVMDAIELASGETAVLAGNDLHLLSDFAAEVWRRSLAGQMPGQICAEAIERFGSPPGGAEAANARISQTIIELTDLGLL